MIPGNLGGLLEEVTLRQGHWWGRGEGRGEKRPRRQAARAWASHVIQEWWDSWGFWLTPQCRAAGMYGETCVAEMGLFPQAGLQSILRSAYVSLDECV